MDTLHEDLNRILRKPYIEIEDYKEGENIEEYYKKVYENFKKRNDSIFEKIFYGFFKSVIECPNPKCGHRSITFDPFNILSVPIAGQKSINLFCISKYDNFEFKKAIMRIPPNMTLHEIKEHIGSKHNIEPEDSHFYLLGPDKNIINKLKKKGKYTLEDRDEIPNRMSTFMQSENQAYKSLELDLDDFLFLVEDTVSELNETSEQITVYLANKFTASNSNFMKPLKIDKKIKIRRLYEFFFEIMIDTFKREPEFRRKTLPTFEEIFGTSEHPKNEKEFPYILLKNREKIILDLEKDDEVEFQDGEIFQFDVKATELLRTYNLGRKLSIEKSEIRLKTSITSVEDCIRSFTMQETLDSMNTWYCKKCNQHQEARKHLYLHRLPKILIVHLKRFSKYAVSSFGKNDTFINFPLKNLDLGEFVTDSTGVEADKKYDLIGVIDHYGGMGAGHYIATCWSNYRGGTWIKFDDDDVSKADEDEIVTKAAYVLFYKLRE